MPATYSRQILRYSLRKAPIVYRLIGATLIGNFVHDPFFLKIEILPIREHMLPLGSDGLRQKTAIVLRVFTKSVRRRELFYAILCGCHLTLLAAND